MARQNISDNRFRVLGDCVGRAWHDGKELKSI